MSDGCDRLHLRVQGQERVGVGELPCFCYGQLRSRSLGVVHASGRTVQRGYHVCYGGVRSPRPLRKRDPPHLHLPGHRHMGEPSTCGLERFYCL